MCTCSPNNNNNNNNREEYYTALSEFETPEDRYTSTQYEEEFIPAYYSTPISPQIPAPISTPRRIQSYQRMPRTRVRGVSRRDLTSGVAIVPRRIDFDASDVEEIKNEEIVRERLQQLQSPARLPLTSETGAPGTYRLRRTRATQYPLQRRQYVPRMVQITPCGKCLRI
ncbi:PREDICTED: uncharacterized protein LOC108748434 [Trachymyrmex septentrionalis]|uniref:uncharacterized protein LOC108748434 n=1 Tax=Trachymyrmex septentrionalis TaxID=34720 RepID=UPI00084F3DAC|nr:PREDICTED: uncharacterized protein LOC108748434 [Trachymyrmex septentrionalis]XP_018342116.1 PREDICTED: uncharacterized protein LOC108748434 [Trachymyrmex septentrionalis]